VNNFWSWPNLVTYLRIILGPVLVVVYYNADVFGYAAAAGVFVLASVSDWLDGYLARTLEQTSMLGAFLDPVADKIIVAIALVLLAANPDYQIIVIPAMIIIVREIVVSGLREWMAGIGHRAAVTVSYIGKCKTALQMVAIAILLFSQPSEPSWPFTIGYVLLYFAASLALWSMVI